MSHCRIAVAALAVLCGACGGEPQGAAQVARAFWEAARAGDNEQVTALVASGGAHQRVNLGRHASFEHLVIGESVIDGDVAEIETEMSLEGFDGDTVRIMFPTHLVMQHGAWKVALDETMVAMRLAAVDGIGVPRSDSLVARDTAR